MKREMGASGGPGTAGAALLVALLMLTVLGVLSSMFMMYLAGDFREAHLRRGSQSAFNLAEAGMEKALWELYQPGSSYRGESGTQFGEGAFTVKVLDEDEGAGRRIVVSEGCVPAVSPRVKKTIRAVVTVDEKRIRGASSSRPDAVVLLSWKELSEGEITSLP